MNKHTVEKLHGLVDRGRCGDQNALATIEEVRKNAHGGMRKAQESLRVILAYMSENPVKPTTLGTETSMALGALRDPGLDPQNILRILCFLPHSGDTGALEAACVILAGGPPMSVDRVKALDEQVIPPLKPPFHFGLEAAGDDNLFGGGDGSHGAPPHDPVQVGYISAGHCIGLARRIQQVRGGAPFEMISPELGWELDPREPLRMNK